jgi:hypothetical protein
MASESPETDSFLATIANKIALLQALAESYRAARDGGAFRLPREGDEIPPPAQSGLRAPSTAPVDLPTGAFRTMGMASAVKVYLAAAKRKQSLKEIASALKEGGLATIASDFEKSLNTTLYRLKNEGVLLRFKDGWDLADAYPEHFRQRLAKDSQPTKKQTRAKAKRTRTKRSAKTPRTAKASAKKSSALKIARVKTKREHEPTAETSAA